MHISISYFAYQINMENTNMEFKMKNSAVDLTDLAIGIVVLGIVVSIGATILLNVRDTNTEKRHCIQLS